MKTPPNFDHLAGVYRWLERFTFGNLLWQCRCAQLDKLRSCRTALVIGDGDGRFTARLLEINPFVQIDAVDSSGAMLRALVQQAGANADRVRIHHADVRTFSPPQPCFDLVATHFFLDCLTTKEVATLANQLRRGVSPSSLWVVSEFAIPSGWFKGIVARLLVAALYLAFAILTRMRVFRLPDYHSALSEAGFVSRSSKRFASGLVVSEIWAPANTSNA